MDKEHASLVLIQQQQLRIAARQAREIIELKAKVEYFMPKLSLEKGDTLVVVWSAVDEKITFNIKKYLENGSPHESSVMFSEWATKSICLCTNNALEYITMETETTKAWLQVGAMYTDLIEVYLDGKQALEMLDRLQELFQEVYDQCNQGNTTIVENFNEFCKRCEIARNAVRDFSK